MPHLTLALLRVWDSTVAYTDISSKVGLMTPITHNPRFLQGGAPDFFMRTDPQTVIRLNHVIAEGTATLKPSLRPSTQSSTRTWFQTQQLTAFVCSLVTDLTGPIHLTPFEKLLLLLSDGKTSSSVLELYALLRGMVHAAKPLSERRWAAALGREITQQEWKTAHHYTGVSYLSSRLQERNYMGAHWYSCPDQVHRIYPHVPDICWRCTKATGTYLHIWWQCP